MALYQVKADSLWLHPHLSTQVNGIPVSLNGSDGTHTRPATKDYPERKSPMKAATQEQLEYLFKEGNPLIEEVPAEVKTTEAEPKAVEAGKKVKD